MVETSKAIKMSKWTVDLKMPWLIVADGALLIADRL